MKEEFSIHTAQLFAATIQLPAALAVKRHQVS